MSRDLSLNPATPLSSPQKSPAPPRLRPPSERDFNVYKQVKIWRHPQWEVAVDLKVHYSRVSQIVKKVECWLAAGGAPTDPAIRDHAARHRLARATHKLRLVRAVELATCAMEAEPKPHTTTKRRLMSGSEIWREETASDAPVVNLAAVRLLVRATESLHKLDKDNAPSDAQEPASEQNLLPAVFDFLCRWRASAEADGRLQASPDINALVAAALNGLLGTSLAGAQGTPPLTDESTPQEPLNMSAGPAPSNSTNANPETSCAELAPGCAEKNSKLERPVGLTPPATAVPLAACIPPSVPQLVS